MSGTITMTGEEYDAMAGELDRVSRELSCLQSVIAEPDELNAEPASDYETLRRQYLSLRLLTNSALARNRYLCRRDDRDMRAALSVNAANVSAERDTNAMLTDLLEKAEAERDALHAEAEALRAALLGIASVNPAERGIEWAKSYASDGLKGAGSELYARWLDTFKEAEALRAENGRLQADRDRANQYANQQALECNKLSTDLEAARGLLRESRKSYTEAIHWEDQQPVMKKIDAFLTAFPVPEVRCQTCDGTGDVHRSDGEWLGECHCVKTEQGERQEAVAEVVQREPYEDGTPNPCKTLAWSLDNCEDDLPTGTKLYTTPQPGPDVRALVEALEWYEQQASGCRKLTSEGDKCRQALDSDGGKRAQTALAAHRQAQR